MDTEKYIHFKSQAANEYDNTTQSAQALNQRFSSIIGFMIVFPCILCVLLDGSYEASSSLSAREPGARARAAAIGVSSFCYCRCYLSLLLL